MNDILYTVHVDGTDKKFKKGTTYQEIARTYQQEYQHDIVLVFMDDFRNCSRHWKLIVS